MGMHDNGEEDEGEGEDGEFMHQETFGHVDATLVGEAEEAMDMNQ
jgi:hypothetical protein